jgi:hypothetical protein
MTQLQLDEAVARVTGESLRTIARHGFSVADPDLMDYDPEPYDVEDRIVDWDALDAQRCMPALV